MNLKKLGVLFAVGAAIGLTIFGVMVTRVTTVEHIGDETARRRFGKVRASFENPTPMISLGEHGELITRSPPEGEIGEIRSLRVMAYRGPLEGLVEVDVPLWFLRLKEPAIQFVLRDTGVDLDELGLTVEELRQHGPTIVLDEHRPSGDHVLIWTEAGDD